MGDVESSLTGGHSVEPRRSRILIALVAVIAAAALVVAGIAVGRSGGGDGAESTEGSPTSVDAGTSQAAATSSTPVATTFPTTSSVATAPATAPTTPLTTGVDTTVATTAPPLTTMSSTTAPPPPTSAAPVPPTTVQLSATGGNEMPAIPTAVDGYTPYLGVQSDQTRVFETQGYSTPPTFRGQMNSCADAFWVARWRSLNPDVTVQGGRGPYDADITEYELETYLMPPAATSGYLSGFICERPVFYFGDDVGGLGANLVDVVVEWQYFDASAQSIPPTTVRIVPPPPAPATCPSYGYVFELPVTRCTQGLPVSYVQNRLAELGYGVTADGFFGEGTAAAVRVFQADAGLAVDGVVGSATWRAIGGGFGLPGYDLNGDGMITPEEIVYD